MFFLFWWCFDLFWCLICIYCDCGVIWNWFFWVIWLMILAARSSAANLKFWWFLLLGARFRELLLWFMIVLYCVCECCFFCKYLWCMFGVWCDWMWWSDWLRRMSRSGAANRISAEANRIRRVIYSLNIL